MRMLDLSISSAANSRRWLGGVWCEVDGTCMGQHGACVAKRTRRGQGGAALKACTGEVKIALRVRHCS